MNLKKETIKIKKIPIPAALFLTLIGLAGGMYLLYQTRGFFSKAASESSPQQVKITNIDSDSFVVSWITEPETTGKIIYGENSSVTETKKDIRDEDKTVIGNYKTHFFLVDNLKEKTKYYFKIVSANKIYTQAGKAYELTTAPEKTLASNDIAQGRILTPEGIPAAGAIVYLSLPNAVTQSGLTEENGYWMISLAKTRTEDLQNYLNYDQTAQIEEIAVQAGKQTASAILTTGNDNPAPNIVLGQNHDFIKTPNPPTPTTRISTNTFPENTAGFLGFQSLGQNEDLKIIYPSEDEKVNSQVPEFFGTGPKGEILNITVESEEKIVDETNVNNKGQWKWSPGNPLTPGSHKITVTYTDKDGFSKTVSQNFVVLAAGTSSLPSFTATPSGEIISPTAKPSTPVPSLTPTVTTKTTPAATSTTAPTEKPPRTTVPSGQPPKSGYDLPTWVFLSGGAMFIIVGLTFLLL